MNNFQKSLLKNKECIQQLGYLGHPNQEYPFTAIAHPNYNWIIIQSKGVDLGLSFDVSFSGTGWKLEDFEKELLKPENIKFWRFTDDIYYNNEYFHLKMRDKTTLLILEHFKIELPTAKQLMDYYYKD